MRTGFTGIFITMFFIAGLLSCKRNPYRVNVSSISVNIEINRLEKDLFTVDPAEIADVIPDLEKKYGGFLQLFSYVINAGDINDSLFNDHITAFCTDKLNYEVYQSVIDKYPDVKSIEEVFIVNVRKD